MFESLLTQGHPVRVQALRQAWNAGKAFGCGNSHVFALINQSIFDIYGELIDFGNYEDIKAFPSVADLKTAYFEGFHDNGVFNPGKEARLKGYIEDSFMSLFMYKAPSLHRVEDLGLEDVAVVEAVFLALIDSREHRYKGNSGGGRFNPIIWFKRWRVRKNYTDFLFNISRSDFAAALVVAADKVRTSSTETYWTETRRMKAAVKLRALAGQTW